MRAVASAVFYFSSSGIAFIGKTAIGSICGLVWPVSIVGHLQARADANTDLTGQGHASLMRCTVKKRIIQAEKNFQGFFFP